MAKIESGEVKSWLHDQVNELRDDECSLKYLGATMWTGIIVAYEKVISYIEQLEDETYRV